MTKIKLRLTAKDTNCRKFAIVFMGIKLAVAFGRDSGAKVGYEAIMINGKIGSGGSAKNWYCYASENSIFEIEIDEEIFTKNKNRIIKWDMEIIENFTMSKERNEKLQNASENLE